MICRRTQNELKRSFWNPFQAIIAPAGGRFISEPGAHRWVMPNGSVIHWAPYRLFGTQGESESSLEGLGASVIFGDEATQYPDEFFDHTLERTSQPSVHIVTGQQYPSSQVVWLSRPASDTRFVDIARAHHKAGLSGSVILSRTRDVQTPEFLEKMRRTHSKAHFDAVTQEVAWATMPINGAIFSDFKPEEWPEGNLLSLDLDKSHPTYLAIDPGVTTTSCLWIQVHNVLGSPLAVVVDEWHPNTPTSTQDVVREASRRSYNLTEVIIDPAADSRTRAAGLATEARILARQPNEDPDGLGPGLGVEVRSVIPQSRRGVRDGVYRLLARFCAADGTRSLVVRRALWDAATQERGIRFSLQNYKWDPQTGDPLKGQRGRHADHCIDALRYWMCLNAWHGPATLTQQARPRLGGPKARPTTPRNTARRVKRRAR